MYQDTYTMYLEGCLPQALNCLLWRWYRCWGHRTYYTTTRYIIMYLQLYEWWRWRVEVARGRGLAARIRAVANIDLRVTAAAGPVAGQRQLSVFAPPLLSLSFLVPPHTYIYSIYTILTRYRYTRKNKTRKFLWHQICHNVILEVK